MSDLFLEGPITTGASFMMVSIQNNNQPYFLNATGSTGSIIYYWEKISTPDIPPSIGIFISYGTVDNITITNSNTKGYVGFDNNNALINITTNIPFKIIQNQYATWNDPNIFLSGAIYTIAKADGTPANIYTDSNITNTIPANNIIILPFNWYFNCTNSGAYNSISDSSSSLTQWACSVNSTLPLCENTTVIPQAWTNINDCIIGNSYIYCGVGQSCGTNDCNGPCNQKCTDCKFANNTYNCNINDICLTKNTKWWTSPYFIGGIIGLGVLLIVIIIAIVAVSHHGKKVVKAEQSPDIYL